MTPGHMRDVADAETSCPFYPPLTFSFFACFEVATLALYRATFHAGQVVSISSLIDDRLQSSRSFADPAQPVPSYCLHPLLLPVHHPCLSSPFLLNCSKRLLCSMRKGRFLFWQEGCSWQKKNVTAARDGVQEARYCKGGASGAQKKKALSKEDLRARCLSVHRHLPVVTAGTGKLLACLF